MFRAWLGVEIRTVVLKSRMTTICLATLVAREAGITEAFTPHDLRRTARTLMSEIGIPQEVAEACLGHVQPAIVSTYNRHSFPKEKADAWQRLADRIDEIEGVVNRPVPRKRSSRKSGDVIAFTARRQSA